MSPIEFEDEVIDEAQQEAVFKSIPTIDFWQRYYGRSCEGNDQKAVRIFKDYEPKEKHRRMQFELQQIKDGKVAEQVLHTVIGKKRMQKYQGYDKWAGLMLMWMAAKK